MMRRNAWVTMLALSVSLVPMGLAQTSQKPKVPSMQPGTELFAWTQDQKPQPVPAPKPVPLPDQQQPEQRPETPPPSQPVSGQQDQAGKQPATQTFSGTIMKAGDKYVLK